VEILFNIHQSDISETEHFGHWTDFKKANYQSWANFLDDYIKTKIDYLKDFFSDNNEELSFIKQLEDRIYELLPYCSEERYLIHGDYGLHNTLGTTPGKITGIIDWELSKFGDFVYDIAWLEFWAHYDKQTYKEAYRELYESKKGKEIENYEKRLQCYTLCVVLHMVYFNCTSGQLKAYQEMKTRFMHL
jgi:aminoglycoside phosphotransferase (APT) family kinase protein